MHIFIYNSQCMFFIQNNNYLDFFVLRVYIGLIVHLNDKRGEKDV